MKTKKKRNKDFLSTLKPVGPRQVPTPVGPRRVPINGVQMPAILVFPNAETSIPLSFSQKELEAIAAFVAKEHVMEEIWPGSQMDALLPMARAILRGWLNQK